ncbi:polyribonucleotide nucleotidyltransferase, partial [Tanacetum coccineum]
MRTAHLVRFELKTSCEDMSKLSPEYGEEKQPKKPLAKAPSTTKHSVPNVVLWNSTSFEEDDDGTKMPSSLSLKPNLSLKMGKEDGKGRFTDMILVRGNSDPLTRNNKVESTVDSKDSTYQYEQVNQAYEDSSRSNIDESRDIDTGSVAKLSSDATLQGRPKRLDQPLKETSNIGGKDTRIDDLITKYMKSEDLPPIPLLKDREDTDWKRADDLLKTSGRAEVEMIRCSTRGFVVSFGCLIGFLPYRNLATKWKFIAFESWLRRKGLDPSTYRKSLGIIGNYNATSEEPEKIEGELSSHMELEDLFALYDQEKVDYLSTFIGHNNNSNMKILNLAESQSECDFGRQRIQKANLFGEAERAGRIDPEKEKPHGENLDINHTVLHDIIEEVPALIHQTEVSWDVPLNPTTSFKIGQVVEAKVHQLDFSLERIYLSLKEITPDPLTESLEAVIDDHSVSDSTLEAERPEDEWADLELLVNELRKYEGIELVTKGRFFLSPGLTPTFQVYMASMFKNQYKLLARAGNKVQEVVVQTWLGAEEMKHAILRLIGSKLVYCGLNHMVDIVLIDIGFRVCGRSEAKLLIVMDVSNHAMLGFGGDPCLHGLGTLKQYKLAKLTPIEAGCCRPPSQCGYPAVNASHYDLSFHPISSNKDCKRYKNAKAIKCYNCDSCKAGVAQHIKTEWRVIAIFNVILFVVLVDSESRKVDCSSVAIFRTVSCFLPLRDTLLGSVGANRVANPDLPQKCSLDASNPFHLHANDSNGTPLISIKLTGVENYRIWASAIKLGLQTKNKMGFITGSVLKSDYVASNLLSEQWDRCNAVVLSWILGSLSQDVY